MFQKSLFNKKILPACEYCEFGKISQDMKMIFCRKTGIVSPYYKCKKFIYAPTKRIPKRMQKLPTFNADEFKI